MKKIVLILFIFSLFSCEDPSKEIELSDDQKSIRGTLDDYLTALTSLNKFNGVLLAAKNDTLLLKKEYNIYDNPDSSSFVKIDHQFDIHSVSKLMTHYLVEKLKQKDLLETNETIDKFYPDFPKGDLITIEMLLDHSSGLPRELQNLTKNEIDLTSDEIVNLAKSETLLFEPGTDNQYSNA